MLDGPAQRLAHVALGQLRHGAEQRVADVASGGRGQAQQALRRRVEPGHALQQQVAQAARELAALVAGGGQELLGEEGVALGAGDDRVRQRRRRRGVGASREQRRQLVALRAVRARAPAPSPSAGRRRRAGACARPRRARPRGRSPSSSNPPVVEVVREEDDEIERRRVGPVQVLEHQQHRRGRCAVEQQRQRLLEHPQLRARRLRVDLREPPSGRSASTNGWYGSSVPTRSIERPSRTSNPASRARAASSDASRVLPMPASPATSAVVPLPACAASRARSSCPSSRTRPTNTSLAGASIQAVSRRRPWRGRRPYASRGRRIRRPAAEDTRLRPMRSSASTATIRSIRRTRGGRR